MSYGLHQAYDRLAKLGDPLAQANKLLDWEGFRPIEEELYDNKTEKGGHPNIDFVLMMFSYCSIGIAYPIKGWNGNWPIISFS